MIQALAAPHKRRALELAGQAFKDACDRLGPTVEEIQNIDERWAE